jgi:hypothetical protein
MWKLAPLMLLLAASVQGQAHPAHAPTASTQDNLCSLEHNATQGSQVTARVSGVFHMSVLTDPHCSNQQGTWIEFSLKSQRNRKKLSRLLEKSTPADVVFSGDFYGPPVPDPKLPKQLRDAYHPGWGHLGAFPTKLIVYEIEAIRAAPRDTAPESRSR